MRCGLICLASFGGLLIASCGDAGRPTFPASPDPSKVRIGLERTVCLGECPDYTVEIRGDGKVVFRGRNFVLVEGEYSWSIPQGDVVTLVELFRQADYFKLKDRYAVDWFDLPTHKIQLTIGEHSKQVIDYGGLECNSKNDPNPPCMPEIVADIENAIDNISGAASLIAGNEETIALLERVNFDFRSPEAAKALSRVLNEREAKLAREFLERGAPLETISMPASSWTSDAVMPPILLVSATGDVELARLLIEKGALPTDEMRRLFLVASAASGNPKMVQLALQHISNLQNLPMSPVIAVAQADASPAGTYAEEEYKKDKYKLWLENFDALAAMKMLLDAGASPTATDDEGNTALHVVRDAARARLLIDAGADPNAVNLEKRTPLHDAANASVAEMLIKAGAIVDARDEHGATPLFEQWDANIVRQLLKAGADPDARNTFGHTALFFANTGEAASAMIEGGVDVNAVDNDGTSALSTAKSIDAAIVILRAGGQLPTDPEELARFTHWAEINEADELLRAIRQKGR